MMGKDVWLLLCILCCILPSAECVKAQDAPGVAPDAAARQSKIEPYRGYTDAAVAALQPWYQPAGGTWSTTGWWNSANALEAVIDYTLLTHHQTYLSDIANTFEKHQAGRFLNKYYDDEGWWALAWIKAYDLTGEARYLDMAKTLFEDIKGGWDEAGGGGVWWNKDRRYKNAIANELFLTLAARLHRRTPKDKGRGSYQEWAEKEWAWFEASGMINAQNLINDGLNAEGKNNNGTTWTYNQGVILGGLVEMAEITRRKSYLLKAQAIAEAAMRTLVNTEGILVEPCEKNDGCGGDGPQFKGIFARNLGLLYARTKKRAYRDFLRRNADSLWTRNRNEADQFGLKWAGPFDRADASRQSAALDLLNAALR
jgi:predicted alpha-1,6-mannanase (GH76 family)